MIYPETITGLTVYMRSVVPDDAQATFYMRSDASKTKYMHAVSGTVEDQRNYIIGQQNKPGDYLFTVFDYSNKIIGMRGIYNVTEESCDSGRTIGYGDAFQNMEAIILGLDFAFDTLGVKKVYMDAAADNKSVRGIQIQLGAKEYKRGYIEGFDYENVSSVLEKEDFIKSRKKIISLIQRHVQRMNK